MKKNEMDATINLVRSFYGDGSIPLHRPIFEGNERKYLKDCIDSNFVSSVGSKVNEFEKHISDFTGSPFAIATVNGTAALHIGLQLAGVHQDDEVITQAVTFIATCNALSYIGARAVFIDVDKDTFGMSPTALKKFLIENAQIRDGFAWNKRTGRRIKACVPMHTFGFPCRIEEIAEICLKWGIELVEDAAESLGSFVGEKHTGTFGSVGTFSFNGNKIITTGGGGMIVTNDKLLAERARHITTTAKISHPFEFIHDEVGYNYRLPNLNSALGCAQMEKLPKILTLKQNIANGYRDFFQSIDLPMAAALPGDKANNWLNAIILNNKTERDKFLEYTNAKQVNTRPIWRLMSKLKMFCEFQNDGLKISHWLEERIVNLPSSVPFEHISTDKY